MTETEFSTQLVNLEQSLLSYANFLRLNITDSEDLVQDTFIKALLNRDKFRDTRYLKAWVFTILRNTFITNYRHGVRFNIKNDGFENLKFNNCPVAKDSDNPESLLSIKEITKSIEELNVKFRVPIKMYIEGYKYSEIADKLHLKLGTVKCRIFIARHKLMERIQV